MIKLGKRRCKCGACGLVFAGVSVFDLHRTGEYDQVGPDYGRRCLTDAEMVSVGMKWNGVVWSSGKEFKSW